MGAGAQEVDPRGKHQHRDTLKWQMAGNGSLSISLEESACQREKRTFPNHGFGVSRCCSWTIACWSSSGKRTRCKASTSQSRWPSRGRSERRTRMSQM